VGTVFTEKACTVWHDLFILRSPLRSLCGAPGLVVADVVCRHFIRGFHHLPFISELFHDSLRACNLSNTKAAFHPTTKRSGLSQQPSENSRKNPCFYAKISVIFYQVFNVVRLKDIAEKAGVSIATVSKFLSGKGSVSPAAEERIRQAIESLGLKAENIPRRKNSLKAIGVVIPDIENPFFSSMVKSLELLLFRYGFFLLLCNTENDVGLEEHFIHYLNKSGVKGIFLVPASSTRRAQSLSSSVPVVLLDRGVQSADLPLVATNHYQGARIAVSYLLQKGRQRIAFVGGRRDVNVYEERFRGYRDELSERGFEVDPNLIVEGDFSFHGGYHAIDVLLTRTRSFDAIFAANDLVALGAIERCQEKGIRVPDDVAVVGFDDIWLSRLSHPRLTTVRQPVYELCREAMVVLLESLNRGVRPELRLLEPQLVIRESC
jgi:DNA-binding LacI/PurR family transcriptional regulator